MRNILGFKLYKDDETTFIQAVVLLLILLVGYIVIDMPEARQTILIIGAVLIGFIFAKILKR